MSRSSSVPIRGSSSSASSPRGRTARLVRARVALTGTRSHRAAMRGRSAMLRPRQRSPRVVAMARRVSALHRQRRSRDAKRGSLHCRGLGWPTYGDTAARSYRPRSFRLELFVQRVWATRRPGCWGDKVRPELGARSTLNHPKLIIVRRHNEYASGR